MYALGILGWNPCGISINEYTYLCLGACMRKDRLFWVAITNEFYGLSFSIVFSDS